MSFSKLKQIHVVIIGSFLCVAAGVAMFFLAIKPQQEAYATAQKRCDDAAGCWAMMPRNGSRRMI